MHKYLFWRSVQRSFYCSVRSRIGGFGATQPCWIRWPGADYLQWAVDSGSDVSLSLSLSICHDESLSHPTLHISAWHPDCLMISPRPLCLYCFLVHLSFYERCTCLVSPLSHRASCQDRTLWVLGHTLKMWVLISLPLFVSLSLPPPEHQTVHRLNGRIIPLSVPLPRTFPGHFNLCCVALFLFLYSFSFLAFFTYCDSFLLISHISLHIHYLFISHHYPSVSLLSLLCHSLIPSRFRKRVMMKMMMRIEDGERGDKYRDNSSDWMNWDSFSPYSKSVSSLNFTHTHFLSHVRTLHWLLFISWRFTLTLTATCLTPVTTVNLYVGTGLTKILPRWFCWM